MSLSDFFEKFKNENIDEINEILELEKSIKSIEEEKKYIIKGEIRSNV